MQRAQQSGAPGQTAGLPSGQGLNQPGQDPQQVPEGQDAEGKPSASTGAPGFSANPAQQAAAAANAALSAAAAAAQSTNGQAVAPLAAKPSQNQFQHQTQQRNTLKVQQQRMALTEQELEENILSHQREGASPQEISWLRAQQQLLLQQRKQQALGGAQPPEFLNAGVSQVAAGTPAFIADTTAVTPVEEGGDTQFAAAFQPPAEESVKTEQKDKR